MHTSHTGERFRVEWCVKLILLVDQVLMLVFKTLICCSQKSSHSEKRFGKDNVRKLLRQQILKKYTLVARGRSPRTCLGAQVISFGIIPEFRVMFF
jgi:hypothetical protein